MNKKMQSETKKVSSGLFLSSTKKALGPVIAISLLVIVSVVAVVGFQNWYSSYSSKTFVDIETKDRSGAVSIDSIKDGILYIKNDKQTNYTLNTIKVGDIDCEISQNLSLGINSVDIGGCLENSGTNDIVLVTNNEIVEKKLFVKDYSSCVDITNGIVGLWHMDESVISDDFNYDGINLDDWTPSALGIHEIINGRLRLTRNVSDGTGWTTFGSNYYIEGDFDIQVDYDALDLNSPAATGTNFIYMSASSPLGSNFAYVDIQRKWGGGSSSYPGNGLRTAAFVNNWGTLKFDTSNTKQIDQGKFRITKVGSVVSTYYYESGSWQLFQSTSDVDFLQDLRISLNVAFPVVADDIQAEFDNLIISKGDIVQDYSSNSNNGTIYGRNITSGKIGDAFSFDGVNDYVNMGNIYDKDGNGPFSLSTWFKSTASGGVVYGFISKSIINSPYTGYSFGFNQVTANIADEGKIGLAFVDNSLNIVRKQTVNKYNDGLWHHTIATYDGSKSRDGMLIYVDGELASVTNHDSSSFPGTLSNIANFEIGARDGENQPFSGNLDEVAIYDRVLSAQEVQEIYQGGLAKKPICDP